MRENKEYRNKEGKLHRVDGPAVEGADGIKEWWADGKRHRINGPAVEWADGGKEWWVDDKRHRINGPAVEWSDGGKEWWVEGKRHRVDGPALAWADGSKEWWVDDKRHRVDGPALEWADGSKTWWVDGKRVEEKDLPGTSLHQGAEQQNIPEVVRLALDAVQNQRNKAYDRPERNFQRIAALVGAMGLCGTGAMTPAQTALFQVCVKLSRLMHTPDHKDSVVDIIGYMICYQQCIEAAKTGKNSVKDALDQLAALDSIEEENISPEPFPQT